MIRATIAFLTFCMAVWLWHVWTAFSPDLVWHTILGVAWGGFMTGLLALEFLSFPPQRKPHDNLQAQAPRR